MSYLIIDDPTQLSTDELASVIKEHRANTSMLVEQNKILLAGPLFEPLIAEGYNGIFLYNVDNNQGAMNLFMTDPAVNAGVFKPEMFFFDSSDPVTRLPALERKDKLVRLADPDIPDQWTGRAYVLAKASPDAKFADNQSVLINALMTPINDSVSPIIRMLFLDFETVENATANFECHNIDQWSFFGFYGTKNLTRLHHAGSE